MKVEHELLSSDELAVIARTSDAARPWVWTPEHMSAEHYQLASDCVEYTNLLLGHIAALTASPAPVPMRLTCPECGELHIDEGEFAIKPHHTHACRDCGNVWRPAVVPTVGVRFLPGLENGGAP